MNRIKRTEVTQQLKPKLSRFNKERYLKICFFIILFCISYLIFFEPFIGVANNGDFQRFSMKFGVNYAYDPWSAEYYSKTFFNSVINNFIIVKPAYTGFFSSYEIVGWLSRGIALFLSKQGLYNIRFMGAACLIVYMAACGFVFYSIRDKSKLTVIVTGILTIILSLDPYMVQYFNSFYSEMGMIIPLISFFSFFLLFRRNGKIRWVVLQGISALMATAAKPQNIVVIVPLLVLIGLEIRKKCFERFHMGRLKYAIISLVLLCFVSLGISASVLLTNTGTNITIYNVIVSNMLPVSNNPAEQLKKLGFQPEEIQQFTGIIGHTAFENDYYNSHPQTCRKFTRSAELKILINEPAIGFKLIKNKAHSLFQDTTYGNFTSNLNLPNVKASAFPINAWLKKIILFPNIFYYISVIFLSLLIPSARRKQKNVSNLNSVLFFLSLCNLLQFIIVVFGDGNEEAKHFFAINLEFEVIVILLIISLIREMCNYQHRKEEAT